MKRVILLITFQLLVNKVLIYAQDYDEYMVFHLWGSCSQHVNVDVYNDDTGEIITTVPHTSGDGNASVRKIYDTPPDRLFIVYNPYTGCGTDGGIFDIDRSQTEFEYMYTNLCLFWAPVMSSLSAREYSSGYSSEINANSHQHPIPTRKILSNRIIEIVPSSAYTGNDFQWQIKTGTGDGVVKMTVSGRVFRMSAQEIASRVGGYNIDFWIQPRTPEYVFQGHSYNKTYRDTWQITQKMKIYAAAITSPNDPGCSKNYIDVTVTADFPQNVNADLNVIQDVYYVGTHHLIPGHSDFSINSGPRTFTRRVYYSQLEQTPIDLSKPFGFGLYLTGSSYVLSEHSVGNMYFEPLSELITDSIPFCPENTNGGTLILKRDPLKTEFEERFDFRKAAGCSTALGIDRAFMAAGKDSIHVPGFSSEQFCIGRVRVIGDTVQCFQTKLYKINPYPKPSIAMVMILSPWCQYDSAKVLVDPGAGTADIYYLLKQDYSIHSSSDYPEFTGIDLDEISFAQIRDIHGCLSDFSDTIDHPDLNPITFNINKIPPQCTLDNNGTIEILNAGGGRGTGTYEYGLNGDFQSTLVFNGLSGNTPYTISVRDKNYTVCLTEKVDTIIPPDPVNLTSFTVKQIKCFGETGSITQNGEGGTGTLTSYVSKEGGSVISGPLNQKIDVTQGNYTLWLQDANNCKSPEVVTSITEPSRVAIENISVEPEKCRQTGDGSITVTSVTGGVPPYTIGSTGGSVTDFIISDLTADVDYTLRATDDSGCYHTPSDLTVRLDPPPLISVDFDPYPPLCPGGNSGYIHINEITNGNGGYTYSFNPDGPFIGIHPGDDIPVEFPETNYTIYLRDMLYDDNTYKFCSNNSIFSIPDKQEVDVISHTINKPACYGENNGSIILNSISGPGDQDSYTYEWRDSLHQVISTLRNLTNVSKGNYELTIRDADNCPKVIDIYTVSDPPRLVIDSLEIVDASCAGVANGEVTIHASGGTETNNYEFSDGGSFIFNQPTFENLAPGTTYEFSVMDDNGCITSAETTLSAGEVILALDDTSMVTCYGDDDGSISLIASGGSNYMYHISGPEINTNSTIPLFNNLGAGAYHLYVADAKTNCESEEMMVNISEPDPLIITTLLLDSSACDKDLGHISFTVEGGNGGNQIIWTDSEDNVIENIVLDALHAGTYTVSIEDRKGCLEENIVTVPERPGPDITEHEIVTETWCNRPLGKVELIVEDGSPEFHYNWSHQSGLDNAVADSLRAGTYQITVTDRYLCQDMYEFVLEDGPALSPSADITDAHCNMNDGLAELIVSGGVSPYSYAWPDSVSAVPVTNPVMTDLYAGEYEVTITDEIGCDTSFFVNISNINGPESAPVSITSSWCGLPTGTAQMSVTGGDLPYSYSWRPDNNSTILSTTLSADGLTAGEYLFQVTDGIGCIDYYKINVEDSAELEPNLRFISMDSAACGNPTGALTVAMDSGLAPYHYQWNTAADDTLGILSGVTAGTYQVTATDERGCVKSLEMAVADRHLPVIRFLSMQNAYCGSPTGQFVVTLHHGREPFVAYLQDSPDVTYPFTLSDSSSGTYIAVLGNLTASENLYTIQASDADGCESNTVSNYIDEDNPMQLTLLSVQPVSCYGGSDGSAAIAVEDGVEPYTYVWSENSVNNAVNNNLTGGTFSVTVTDAMECTRISSGFSVPEPSQVRITRSTVTQPSCFGLCDGSITPYASGGTGALIYVWNNSDTVRTITGLCAGEADLRVIDANNCPAETSVTVTEPPMETIAAMPDEAEVCEGQVFILDPGEGYTSCVWTSTNGFTSDEHTANITQGGTYFLSALSPGGCAVSDTFRLIVSDNLLEAEFLMASEGYVGDTIVIIEVSWPYADVCSWTLPEEADVITDLDYYKELIFRNSGTFYVEMNARLATCVAMKGKYIDIYSTVPGKDSEIPAEENVISSLNIFPNPAQEYLTLNVKLAQEEDIRVEMLGVSGNKVSDSVVGYGLSEYEVNLDVSSLMPGVYLLRLIAGGQVETRMLVVH